MVNSNLDILQTLTGMNKANVSLWGKQLAVFVANDKNSSFQRKIHFGELIFHFGFNSHFPFIHDVKYLLMCLCTIYKSSLAKCVFESFAHFLLCYLLEFWMQVLYWTGVSPNIFYQSSDFLYNVFQRPEVFL